MGCSRCPASADRNDDDASAALQQELRAALDSLQAVSGELRAVAEDGAADPEELARVEGRLGALGRRRPRLPTRLLTPAAGLSGPGTQRAPRSAASAT